MDQQQQQQEKFKALLNKVYFISSKGTNDTTVNETTEDATRWLRLNYLQKSTNDFEDFINEMEKTSIDNEFLEFSSWFSKIRIN